MREREREREKRKERETVAYTRSTHESPGRRVVVTLHTRECTVREEREKEDMREKEDVRMREREREKKEGGAWSSLAKAGGQPCLVVVTDDLSTSSPSYTLFERRDSILNEKDDEEEEIQTQVVKSKDNLFLSR